MNLVLTVLNIVAPVVLVAGAGFAWVRLGFEYRIQFVTGLSMTLALPCLIFVSLMQSEISPQALASVSMAAILGYAAIAALAWGACVAFGLDIRSYLVPFTFGNTGNLGLPLALFAFGNQGLEYALVVFAVSGVLSFSFGLWVVSGGMSLRHILREPLVGATLLGALFLWQGWQTPQILTRSLELIGQMAIPLMLLTLGVAVARLRPGNLGRALWVSLLRVAVCVAVGWIVASAFQLDPVAFGVLVVQLSTPVAVTLYLLAEKYGADSDAVAGLVVVSTLMAVITLPLTLVVLI